MKNFLTTFLMLCLLSATFGCSNKDSEPSIPAVGNLTMKKDGAEWKSTSSNGNRMTAGNAELITVAGVKLLDSSAQNMETVTMSITSAVNQQLQTGEYIVRDSLPRFQITFNNDPDPATTWISTSGNLTISRLTESNIQGSFSGTLKRDGHPDIVVADGKFNINLMAF